MDISQNSLSNEALWIFYDRLLQQARHIERSLANYSDHGHSVTPTDPPQTTNPVTPIQQPNVVDSSDLEDVDDTQDNQSPSSLDQDERQVTIVLSSSPAPTDAPPAGPDQSQDPTIIANSSVLSQNPSESRVPLQSLQRIPRIVPDMQIARLEILATHEPRQTRRRIIIKRETIDEYRALVDSFMGVKYNVYTDSPDEFDSSESIIEEPPPIGADVLSLLTVHAYVHAGITQRAAYDISELGLAREGNYYIGRFDFSAALQWNRARFRERTWADLVSKAGALGDDYVTAYPKVCDYLRSRRKLVAFCGVGAHATVLTLVRGSKIATFFDTSPSQLGQSRAFLVCSSVIRSSFNETTEGWTLQIAQVGRQNKRANNCALHSLLRVRDELEDNREHDTNETSANTLRIYLALRGAYGEDRYPLANIIN